MHASQKHYDSRSYWWIKERYTDMARIYGSESIIPILLKSLPKQAKENRSTIATRSHAVDALANITGWDAKAELNGSVDSAAQAYLEECGRALGQR